MAARLAALLPRLIALTVIWLLATSTFTLAAGTGSGQPETAETAAPPERGVLVVPDVRKQAYVFAKGILQDEGFAWRVRGSVQGYAANTVAIQVPAPGTRVVDNGAPTVVLSLARNPAYGERGLPENESSYEGTRIVLAATLKANEIPPAQPAETDEPLEAEVEEPGEAEEPAEPPKAKTRKPAFLVPGAPVEPADEIPLPRRARLLEKRLAAHSKPTNKLVSHWLYQHAWIVTGARFGWSRGDEALRVLIRVDRDLERRWGIGSRSEAVARRALVEVERKAK